MSTSLLYHAIRIRGYKYSGTEYRNGQVIFTIDQVVFDHFHVIKLFNDKLSDLHRALYREASDMMPKAVLRGRDGSC
jgi:Transposase